VLATPQGGTARERSLTVVGIYSLGESDAERSLIYVNLPTAESELGMPGQVTEVTLNLERVGLEHRVITALAAALPGYEIDSWETLRPELRQTLDVKQAYTTLFGIVVLFIACIGILNLLLMAVFERTREMGVLAALGMKGRQIMTLFVLEGAMIGVIGAVIGGLLGLVATLAVAHVGIDLTMLSGMGDITVLLGSRLRPVFAPGQSVVRCLAAVLMAALAALIPAWRASRQQPAEVLHHV
jgi:putative ABC transport system permease protein